MFPSKQARKMFFKAFPKFEKVAEKIDIHHRLPQRYRDSGTFKPGAIDNLSNLQALPKGLHQKIVTPLWNSFSRRFPNATQKQIQQFAKVVDMVVEPYANNVGRIADF